MNGEKYLTKKQLKKIRYIFLSVDTWGILGEEDIYFLSRKKDLKNLIFELKNISLESEGRYYKKTMKMIIKYLRKI